MTNYDSFYIGGEWVPAGTAHTRVEVLNPATEEVLAKVAMAENEDVDKAVAAALAAFPSWSQTSPSVRAGYLRAIADAIEARTEEIANLITSEVGTPTGLSNAVQVGWTLHYLRDAADAAEKFDFESSFGGTAVVRKVPVGVVAAVTPWNYPLMQTAAKIAPALATGCTVVLKPSEVSPLNLFVLAEIASEVGLPAGVLNIVPGIGTIAGEHLISHPDVSAVSFTGSTRAGTHIASVAAQDVKRVTLELGGKSAAIILPGGDLSAAVRSTVNDCFANSGQKCVAHTRLLVPAKSLAEVESLAIEYADAQVLGNPIDPSVTVGPLVSDAQRTRVRDHISRAISSGAKLLTGGIEKPTGLESGFFVKPTVFSGVTPEMPIAQEEVFGPVLSILSYETPEEAVEIANGSEYGLGGGIWSKSREEGFEFARQLRTGQVSVNGAIPTADMPFGGFKKSGIGREGGMHALEEFVDLQTIY